MLSLLKNNKGEVSTLVVVGLLVLVGVGVLLTSTLNQNAKTSVTRASNDGPGGQCDMGDNGGCGGPNGCRFWEFCKQIDGNFYSCIDTTNGVPTDIDKVSSQACGTKAINYSGGTSGGDTGGSCMKVSNIVMDLAGGKVGGIKVYRSGGEGDVKIAYMSGTNKVHLFGPSKLPDGSGDTNELIAASYNSAGGFFDTYALPSGSSVKVLVEVSPVGSGSICQTITYTCTSNGTSTNCAVGDTGSAPPPVQPTSPPAQNPPANPQPTSGGTASNPTPTSIWQQGDGATLVTTTPVPTCAAGYTRCAVGGKCVQNPKDCNTPTLTPTTQPTRSPIDAINNLFATKTPTPVPNDPWVNQYLSRTPTPIQIIIPVLGSNGNITNSGTVVVDSETTSQMCTLGNPKPGCTQFLANPGEIDKYIK